MRKNPPVPVYKGLAYRYGMGFRPQILVPTSYVRLPDPRLPKHKGSPGTTTAAIDRAALDRQRNALGILRENENLTAKEDYSSEGFNNDRYYDNLMAMYQADSSDSKDMREFKALKDTLDNVLVKSGYTQKEIKQFYILNYLGAQQANQKRKQGNGSGSLLQPIPMQRWRKLTPPSQPKA